MRGIRMAGNMAAAVAGKAAATILGLFTFVVLARELGAAGLGEYRIMLTVVTLAALAGDFGLYTVTLRELARQQDSQDRIVGSALTCRLFLTSVAVGATVTVAWLAGLPTLYRYGLLVAGAGWIAFKGRQFLLGVFQEKLHQQYAALAETAGAVTSLAAVLVSAALDAGPVGMLGATALGFAAGFAVSLVFARRLVAFRLRFDAAHWKRLMWTGLPIAGSTALILVHLRADVLLLALFRSPSEVGIYDVGVKLYEVSTAVAYLFGGLLMPLFARDLRDDAERFAGRLGGALSAGAAAATGGMVLLLFFAEPACVLVGGEEFRAAAAPLRVLAVAIAVGILSYVLRFAALAGGRESGLLRVDLMAVLAGLLVHVLLIPEWSYTGAAIGKLVTEVLMFSGMAWLVVNDRVLTVAWEAAGPLAGAAATMVGTLWLLGDSGLPVSAPWPLAALIGVTAYIVLLFLVPGLRRSMKALTA